MPFERPHSSAKATSKNLLKRNPFLVFRLVSLGLLSNLALLSLIFASWNINASLSAGLSSPSTSVFILFSSALLLTCVVFSLLQFLCLKKKIVNMAVDCAWIGTTSIFQLGAAISSTINGAASCHPSSDISVCASSVLLVPATWFTCVLALIYFLASFVSTMAHKDLYPDIWKRVVFEVDWFYDRPQELSPKEKNLKDFFLGKLHAGSDPYFDYYEDIESTAARKKHYPIRDSVEESTPYGPVKIRRGIDHPFTLPSSKQKSPTSQKAVLPLPSLPSKSAAIGPAGSRYLEKFRDSSILSRPETPSQFSKHYHAQKPSFPPSILDVDKPIPLPELSEWVKAESAL